MTSIKNYGIWIRYQSRTGFHNAYKEYREVTMNKAVDALYEEMASRHRVRAPCLQIIKICQVVDEVGGCTAVDFSCDPRLSLFLSPSFPSL